MASAATSSPASTSAGRCRPCNRAAGATRWGGPALGGARGQSAACTASPPGRPVVPGVVGHARGRSLGGDALGARAAACGRAGARVLAETPMVAGLMEDPTTQRGDRGHGADAAGRAPRRERGGRAGGMADLGGEHRCVLGGRLHRWRFGCCCAGTMSGAATIGSARPSPLGEPGGVVSRRFLWITRVAKSGFWLAFPAEPTRGGGEGTHGATHDSDAGGPVAVVGCGGRGGRAARW